MNLMLMKNLNSEIEEEVTKPEIDEDKLSELSQEINQLKETISSHAE